MREPVWIEAQDVLALHGGPWGLRDEALLQSALGRSQQHHAYADTPDIIDMAAAYTVGIPGNRESGLDRESASRDWSMQGRPRPGATRDRAGRWPGERRDGPQAAAWS